MAKQPRHGINRANLKYLVFAGNIREYYQWCSDQGIPGAQALFVAHTSTLNGLNLDPEVVFAIVGTFDNRSDSQAIMSTALAKFGAERKVITSEKVLD